jgi:hypothetical protein
VYRGEEEGERSRPRDHSHPTILMEREHSNYLFYGKFLYGDSRSRFTSILLQTKHKKN